MESEKLLPCPFCGAEDKYLVQAFTRATETFAFWSVECSFCGVEVADDESQEKANAAWNTRAPADMRPALAAETIERCALECLSLISIIGAHPGSSIDSALCAAADAIRALAPTKGDVS